MSADEGGRTPPDKLSLVVFSGDFVRVHYALVMASAAAAIGRPVTLFFTMGASRALGRPTADGRPGWYDLPAGETIDGADDGGATDDLLQRRGVGGFEELLAACVAMGVKIMVCEMGLRALGLTRSDLREDLPLTEGGVVTFLADASRDGAMLFI